MNRREMVTTALASAGLATVDVKRLAVSPDDVAIVVTGFANYRNPYARRLFRDDLKEALRGTAAENLKILMFPPGTDVQILEIPEWTKEV